MRQGQKNQSTYDKAAVEKRNPHMKPGTERQTWGLAITIPDAPAAIMSTISEMAGTAMKALLRRDRSGGRRRLGLASAKRAIHRHQEVNSSAASSNRIDHAAPSAD